MTDYWWGVVTPLLFILAIGIGFLAFVWACVILDGLNTYFVKRMRMQGEPKGKGAGLLWDTTRFSRYIVNSPRKYSIRLIPGWMIILARDWREDDND